MIYILSYYLPFYVLCLFFIYFYVKKKKEQYEPVSIVAFFALLLNYLVLEYISRVKFFSIALPSLCRGDRELLSFIGGLVAFIFGVIAFCKIRKNSKKGKIFAIISLSFGGLIILAWITLLSLLLKGLGRF